MNRMSDFLDLINDQNKSFEEIKERIEKLNPEYDYYFWQAVSHGYVRMDVLKYIVEMSNKSDLHECLSNMLFNSNLYNNHEIILYFFDVLKDSIKNNGLLIHSVLNGYAKKRMKVEYLNTLINLGCKMEFHDGLNDGLGMTPLYSACLCPGTLEILLRFDKDTVQKHLSSYHYYSAYQETKFPIVLKLLYHYATAKDQNWFVELAQNIKLLLEHGYDINLPVIYKNNEKHNITDYLNYYQYNYPDSPVYEALSNILPEPLDPDFLLFKEPKSSNDSEYTKVLKKYKYVKDPAKIPNIVKELENVYKSGVEYSGEIYDPWLFSITLIPGSIWNKK